MNIDISKFIVKYGLSSSEEIALKFIFNNIEDALSIGVRGIAKKCFCSTSVIMNLSKKMGYNGFIDMFYNLKTTLLCETINNFDSNYCLNYSKEKESLFSKYINSNETTPIFIHGIGFSNYIAHYIKDKLMILGYFAMLSEYLESLERLHKISPILIVISKSGETAPLSILCRTAKAYNIPIILFCGTKNSSIEKIADLTFLIKNSSLLDDRNLVFNDFFGNTLLFFEELISKTKRTLK